MNNYKKSQNKETIILIMKFKDIIVIVNINKRLIVVFTQKKYTPPYNHHKFEKLYVCIICSRLNVILN